MEKLGSIEQDQPTRILSSETGNVNPALQPFDVTISEVEEYAIILLSPQGNILSWNHGAEKIKGYHANEIIGRSFKLFYSKEDLEQNLPDTILDEAGKIGKSVYEGWRIKKDGTRFWGNVCITAMHSGEGTITGFLKITIDLTEKKRNDDKIANYIEHLNFKNEELQQSEDRYHKMISEVNDYAIILLNKDGRILDWNRGAEKLKGYTSSEIIGKSIRIFYPLEDKQRNLPETLLDQARKNGFVSHEGYRVRKDGSRFWGNVAITALHDRDGAIIGFSKVTKDLTERKIAEDRLAIYTEELKRKNEELRKSEERYHRMISEVQDYAILLLDSQGIIQNWNTGAQFIKGYQASEVIGKTFKIFYFPEDVAKGIPDNLLKEATQKGKATSEGWRRRKDGSKFWGSIVITALHDASGEVIGFSKVTRDLTDKKKSDDLVRQNAIDLELKNHELERLNAELSSFAYVVSHDLKEPIRKIQVFANRQQELGMSSEQINLFSQKIVSTAARMQKLMEALLSYSQISNDDNQREEIDLDEILKEVKFDLEILLMETGGKIHSGELPVIKGVSFQIRQLFLNLISNSLKFRSPDRTPVINITCSLKSNAELPEELIVKNRRYYELIFSDNGVGFDQAYSSKIFDVFRRLQPTTDASGTGIGLSIVKRVAINHDGLVRGDSVIGAGSKFYVYLPSGK